MRYTRLRTAVGLGALAMAITVAGCTSDDSGSDGSTSSTTVAPDAGQPWPEQVRPPSYGPVDPRATLNRIDELVGNKTAKLLERRNELAYECLSGRGFVFGQHEEQPPATPGSSTITRGEFAASWGFGVTTALRGGGRDLSAVNPSQPRYVDSLNGRGIPLVPAALVEGGDAEELNRARIALNEDTDEETSCATEANDELDLNSSGPFYAASELRRLVLDEYDNDPELSKLSSAYQTCMATAGFDGISSPADAFSLVKSAFDELAGSVRAATGAAVADPSAADADTTQQFDQLNQRELALAQANLGCEGDFTPAALRLIDTIQRDVLEKNKPLVAVIQKSS